jgi:precorrin-6Y C5,15-methyltransferase (decarboxylating)
VTGATDGADVMTTPATVTVVGWDGRPLPAAAAEHVCDAALVVGGARHLTALDRLGLRPTGEQLVVGADGVSWAEAVDRVVRTSAAGSRCVVVASGDPGFFGVVRSLRAADLPLQVWPGATSVAQAFGRIGREWEDAVVVSAHGRPAGAALAVARTAAKVAVLTGPQAPAEMFVEALREAGRSVWVAERLGEDDERVRGGDDCVPPFAEPNVVLADDAEPTGAPRWRSGPAVGSGPWALQDDAFEHRDSMVTKREVRALALAALGPAPGVTVWDVGAGSGSVGIECARLGADVVAVERDVDQLDRLRRNASRHGVRVHVVAGAAPGALAGLRCPDAVFVGGGGPDVVEAVAAQPGGRRVVVALAAVERIRPAIDALRRNGYEVEGVQLQASRLRGLPDGSHRFAATNPVTLVTGVRS